MKDLALRESTIEDGLILKTMSDQLSAKDIYEGVSKTTEADKNPWVLMDHLGPDESAIVRKYFPYSGGSRHVEYQDLIISRLDEELQKLCKLLSEKTGRFHDLLGPFNISEFDDYIRDFPDPAIAHRKFFAYCHFRIRLCHRMEFDLDYYSLPQQTLVRKINELDDRNRLKLLLSLSSYIGSRILFTVSEQSVSIQQAADALWNKLSFTGEVGWYDFDIEFIDAIYEELREDEALNQEQKSAAIDSASEPHALIVELQGRPEFTPALLDNLLKMHRHEDGKIIWPNRLTKQDLVYVIQRLFGRKDPLLYEIHRRWKRTTELFVRENNDGEIVEFSNSDLAKIADKLEGVIEPTREVQNWFR